MGHTLGIYLIEVLLCPVYMVGYWQGCRLVIIAFGLILMFMSAADALRRQCFHN